MRPVAEDILCYAIDITFNNGELMAEEDKNEKFVTIIVEGAAHEWPKDTEISYAQVVTLEVPDYPQHPDITYSVMYENGEGNKPDGILAPGASVKVKDGMIFHVSETGQS